ncbi:hypothetical protein AQ771_04560 [Burkholderia pseudomallei]|nr:hypothetical protein AQ853_03670 [Burkholderia pseudomallei]OMR38610.1 hypothetical protein AQ723_13730 [Burkholderia pseudomallei]OMR61592.1 hypothetical protein AQ727_30575 [Burkholderia pseudomallei]OMT44614.1 hypothetical protein AQ759_11370 [Burkholderia pseudomallei]OMT56076.1 hypothetical protein AQ761_07165 [Burkholderia pseudomallei]
MVTLNIGSIGQTSHDADSIKERRTGEARRPRTSTMVAPGMFGVARERAVPCRAASHCSACGMSEKRPACDGACRQANSE